MAATNQPDGLEIALLVLGGGFVVLSGIASYAGTTCTEPVAKVQDGIAVVGDSLLLLGGIALIGALMWYAAARRLAARPSRTSLNFTVVGIGVILIIGGTAIGEFVISEAAPACVNGLGLPLL